MRRNPEKQKYSSEDMSKNEGIERDLIARICCGDGQAMEALYLLYYDRLFRFAFRVTGNIDDVEEVINDVMFVVWNKAQTFDKTCRVSTWIFGIAYNKARRLSSRPKSVSNDADHDERGSDWESGRVTDWANRLEMQNWLEIGLSALSLEQRAVVELTYFNGLHYREIAEILNCPESTVKTRMFYARKKLASVLKSLN